MVQDFSAEETEVCNFTPHKSTWSIMYRVHICLSKELERVEDKYVVHSRVELWDSKEGEQRAKGISFERKTKKNNIQGDYTSEN